MYYLAYDLIIVGHKYFSTFTCVLIKIMTDDC